jgi:hypothetical protein
MPGEQRLGRNDRSDFVERLATQGLGLGGETAALVVGQALALCAELLTKDPILFAKGVDGRLLMAVDSAGESEQEDVPRV